MPVQHDVATEEPSPAPVSGGADATTRDDVSLEAAGEADADARLSLHEHPHEEAFFGYAALPPQAQREGGEPYDIDESQGFPEASHEDDPHHARRHRTGVFLTALITAIGVLTIGAFLVYHKLIMPTPEARTPRAAMLPTPDTLRAAPPAAGRD